MSLKGVSIMNKNEFGDFLKKLRLSKDLTLKELDKLSNVSYASISRIELGGQIPAPETLKKLATPLGVSYEEFLRKAGYIDEEIKIEEIGFSDDQILTGDAAREFVKGLTDEERSDLLLALAEAVSKVDKK
jgi:transcriptional regulator with XRE-family HTH domain